MQQKSRLDGLFRLLSDSNRRDLIARLHDQEEISVGVSDSKRRIEMVHTHLPKMADHNLIEYERTGNVVRVRRGTRWGEVADVVSTLIAGDVLDQ